VRSSASEHHPQFLPPAFTGLRVESGGVGEGTIFHVALTAGGRTRQYRMRVGEPEPGRVLTENDTASSLVRGSYAHELSRLDSYAREQRRPD
jgi:hypothetical protein